MSGGRIRGMGAATVAAALAAAVGAAGCLEAKEEMALNADGSGRVTVRAAMLPLPREGAEPAAYTPDDARRLAQRMVAGSKGVEAWKDVAYGVAESGAMRFEGTAYFRDVSALAIQSVPSFAIRLERRPGGDLVLELAAGGEGAEPRGEAAEGAKGTEAVAKSVERIRADYAQWRAAQGPWFEPLRLDLSIQLPGRVADAGTLERVGETGVRLSVAGRDLLAAMDAMVADGAHLERVATAGEDVFGGPTGRAELRRRLFGSVRPVRVRMTGEAGAVFDYAAESSAAKAGSGALRERLGLAKPGE